MNLIGWLSGAGAFAPPDATGWITFAEAPILFSAKGVQYAFGESDQDGRRRIELFAAQHGPSSSSCRSSSGSISCAIQPP
jgi:hypothetical protein